MPSLSIGDMESSQDIQPARLLSQTDRRRLFRRVFTSGSLIEQHVLGPNAHYRTRYERAMVERLSSVAGVVKLSPLLQGPTTIAFQDEHGIPLAVVLQTETYDVDALVEFALALATIIAAIHRAGVVHRDINPANIIMAGPERRPVVFGFQIASTSAQERPAFTPQAEIEGTFGYIAPEQTGRTGRAVDHRADLYSFGATLYELATGHAPFHSSDSFQVICDHLLKIPTPPAVADADFPPVLSEIIMRLLQKEPDQRYQSADGIAADLLAFCERRARGDTQPFTLGEHDFPQRLLPPSRLIGREPEIEKLREALEDALAGRGSGFFISGAPGVGKTALSNELRSMVTAKGGWFVMGKFDRARRDLESDAVARAFRNLFRLLLAQPEHELVALRAQLIDAIGSNLAFAITVLPELGVLLQVECEPVGLDSEQAQGRLTHIGLHVLRTIAASRPVVFVVDDLQWASSAPLSFVDAVVSDTNMKGLLFVGAYRAAEVDSAHPLSALLARWERLNVPVDVLLLRNLATNDISTMLQEMLRLQGTEALRLAAAIAPQTDGNPYDTTELINALRHEGALAHGAGGWTWDEGLIRRHLGLGDVVSLLVARINALPPQCASLLEIMACLGGDVSWDLMEAAGDASAAILEQRLTPALDDGLIVLERGADMAIRFRHNRVQQAAYSRLTPQHRVELHLALGRRLRAVRTYGTIAAEQYLPAIERVTDAAERRSVVRLFQQAAGEARMSASDAAVERFLAAAVQLHTVELPGADAIGYGLATEWHAALYQLGRLEDADRIFDELRHSCDALTLADAVCIQISSLTNRNRVGEALALGLDLLGRIGFVVPTDDERGLSIAMRLDAIYEWCDRENALAVDTERPQTTDARALAVARVFRRMMAPAYFCNQGILAWLVLESLALWSDHGPQAALVGPISHAGFVTIALFDDYTVGYRVGRHVMSVSQARGFEPETSLAGFLFSLGMQHWFESFERSISQANAALEGLLKAGDLTHASHTYYALTPLLLQSASSIEKYSAAIETAIAFCIRIGNGQSVATLLPHRQLVRALQGQTADAGSFSDPTFDEDRHTTILVDNPTAAGHFHTLRALSAYVFDVTSELVAHSDAATPLLSRMPGNPTTAVAHLVRAAAIARRIASAPETQRTYLVAELDVSRDWLRARADTAPKNFAHLAGLIDAERAWAMRDLTAAIAAFEGALRDAGAYGSRWHHALIAERAGLFYLEHGLERYGRLLLTDAHALYDDWGACGKARRLEERHPFLRPMEAALQTPLDSPAPLSSDAIDMVGILRASQALSSQTSLHSLKERVVEILAGLTGATAVRIALRRDDASEWLFSPHDRGDEESPPIPLEEAGERGLFPLTAFRYVERTHEPLVSADAIGDDRFARDPYFAPYAVCSLLVVPILSQGQSRAVLLLENRRGRDAFSAGRLDAVMLVAGQLAVSLENALLYASLERKVQERTEALAAANRQLAQLSLTDALTGLANRRGFDGELDAQWRRAVRTKTSVGIAMIDIDEFKKYNDRYGHPAGDTCLQTVAKTLKAGLRPGSDIAARYGGEEFVLILPDTTLAGTYLAAERLRSAIAALGERHAASAHGIVTVSIGVTAFVPSPHCTAADSVKAADTALYEAKRAGRNMVVRAATALGA